MFVSLMGRCSCFDKLSGDLGYGVVVGQVFGSFQLIAVNGYLKRTWNGR